MERAYQDAALVGRRWLVGALHIARRPWGTAYGRACEHAERGDVARIPVISYGPQRARAAGLRLDRAPGYGRAAWSSYMLHSAH